VYDTGLGTTNPVQSSQPDLGLDSTAVDETVTRLQAFTQHWETLLFSTDGAMNF